MPLFCLNCFQWLNSFLKLAEKVITLRTDYFEKDASKNQFDVAKQFG